MFWRRRITVLAVLLSMVFAIATGIHAIAARPSDGSPRPARASLAPAPKAITRSDGSLGDPDTRLACILLTRDEIHRALGGPVGEPTPEYPYCRWTVGDGGFLALNVARRGTQQGSPVMFSVPKLGRGAYVGTNRYLYFARGPAAYWLLFQKVGEFTGVRTGALESLARDVLDGPFTGPPPAPTASLDLSGAVDGAASATTTPLRVFFAGDSLSAGPSWALWEDEVRDRAVSVSAEYQVGTGLVRPDYWNWYEHLAGVMAALDPPAVVFMSGGNDAQDIVVGGRDYPTWSPMWGRVYRQRVGALMSLLAARGRTVLWCGMPPMADPALSRAMAREDLIFRQEANRHPGVAYVDTWGLLQGAGGGFSPSLRLNGKTVPVRLADGVHLNVTGSYLVARAILAGLRAAGTPVALPAG